MGTMPLLEKVDSQSFVMSIEFSQMTRHSCKPKKIENVNTIRRDTKNVAIQKKNNGKLTMSKWKSSRLS